MAQLSVFVFSYHQTYYYSVIGSDMNNLSVDIETDTFYCVSRPAVTEYKRDFQAFTMLAEHLRTSVTPQNLSNTCVKI